jgi:single-stranded DNA-binding protein
MINKIILVGDVWKAPTERTTTKNETTMCILYLVTKDYIVDKNTGNSDNKVYTEKKEWHTIVSFGTTAQYILKNIAVSDVVYVEGQIQTREIMEGETKKYIKDIIVNRNGVVKKLFSKKRHDAISISSDEDNERDTSSVDSSSEEDLLF